MSANYSGAPKRALDIAVSLVLLIIMATPMAVCALVVWLEDGGPVLFRQTRLGADLRPFTCYKFRTMSTDAPHDCATCQLEHPERYITRFGGFLRRTSLDELPQLFNVLRGDMSLIGPRPVIANEEALVELRTKLGIYGIRPGLSGLAQVQGRDCITDRKKAAYDAKYLACMSFSVDLRLVIMTLLSVVLRRGVREGKHG